MAFVENEETAVAAQGNRRERSFTKPFPIAVDTARFDFQFLGTTQNLFHPELAAIAMHQLFRIGSNPRNRKTNTKQVRPVSGVEVFVSMISSAVMFATVTLPDQAA